MTRIAPLSNTGSPRHEPAERDGGPDLVLVRRCARRDSAALREIVGRHQPKLYGFLLQILGSHEDTEEAVQDVFLRVWQQADRFEGRASFATWLYRIATNVAYDRLRRRKARAVTTSLWDVPAVAAGDAEQEALQSLEREERARLLQQALQRLRAEDRLLLVLYYGEELDYDQIREITRYAYPVLKVRLMRARQRLRAAMDALTPETER